MTVSMIKLTDKIEMADEFVNCGATLTALGDRYDCSRKTVRRCVDEIIALDIYNKVKVGQIYTVADRKISIDDIDKDDFVSPFFVDDSEHVDSYWLGLEEFIEQGYELVTETVKVETPVALKPELFDVDNKVVINLHSKHLGDSNNPSNSGVVGKVVSNDRQGTAYNYRVVWTEEDTDYTNVYRHEDLEPFVSELTEVDIENGVDYFVVAPQDSVSIVRIDKNSDEIETRNINKHSGEFPTIREMITVSQDKATLKQAFILMDTKAILEAFSVGRVRVDPEGESVVFVKQDGSQRRVPDDIAGDIIKTVQDYGRDKGEHLVKFLDKLMDNPSFSAIEGMYRFMKHNCIEINSDGSIQAWKGVRDDLYSLHAGTIKNSPTITVNEVGNVYNGDFGKEVRVERSEVDDNPDNTCSKGLHVGSREYASGWASTLIRVSVQPQDVVAVPKDYDGAKMRTCGYTPIEVVEK